MIDITKLLTSQVDSILIDETITIPSEYLENTEIRKISDVIVKGKVYYEDLEYQVSLNIKCDLIMYKLKQVEHLILMKLLVKMMKK